MLLRLADPDERYAAVRLCCDLPLPEAEYARHDGEWRLELARLPVARLEYELEVVDHDGASERVGDPGNPHTAPGAFGDKSVLLLPGYREPALARARRACPGRRRSSRSAGAGSARRSTPSVWSPADAGPGEPLPLLVAHDGPEYDRLAALTHFAAVGIRSGALPRHRVALLAPGERNEWYSASARYAGALVRDVLPALRSAVAVVGPVVGHGREPRAASRCCTRSGATPARSARCSCSRAASSPRGSTPRSRASRATSGSSASCARRCARGSTQTRCPSR